MPDSWASEAEHGVRKGRTTLPRTLLGHYEGRAMHFRPGEDERADGEHPLHGVHRVYCRSCVSLSVAP